MAEFRSYRTYRYIQKNPVIDKVRTVLQDEGLFKNLRVVHEISGVAVATLDNWFHGDTKNPFHSTIAAVMSSVGYEETFQKTKDIDVEAERAAGKKWLATRKRARDLERGKAKPNGSRKPRKKKVPA